MVIDPCSSDTSIFLKVICNLQLYQKTRWTFSKNHPFFWALLSDFEVTHKHGIYCYNSLYLNINRICPRQGSLHFIFLNFFFQDFLKAFFTIKIHIIFVLIQTVLLNKILSIYCLFNTLNSSPIEDLSNKKTTAL